MPTDTEQLTRLHRTALAGAGRVLGRVGPGDLARPTPCAGWDLRTLAGHVVGQNEGFARAIATGEADGAAYAVRDVPDPQGLLTAWELSVQHLLDAEADMAPDRPVHLAEVAPGTPVPAATAVRVHLLDTVVHTWDVAVGLDVSGHRPDEELLDVVAAVAARVPAGASRTAPGAAFSPPVSSDDPDPWVTALARLGRRWR